MDEGNASTLPREESIISFDIGLDEAIDLPVVAVEESVDALLHQKRGAYPISTTAAPANAPAMNGYAAPPTATATHRDISGLPTVVPRRARSRPHPAGGVVPPARTETRNTRTRSSGGGNGTANGHRRSSSANSASVLTCADTCPAQRAAEAWAGREDCFHPMLLCPLQNLGNTCYFNSGVQLLVNCPALVYGLRASPSSPFIAPIPSNSPLSGSPIPQPTTATRLCLRGGAATHALCQEFATLLVSMDMGTGVNDRAFSPIRALDAFARVYPQFEGRNQQDASEMMTALLASLEEDGGQYVEVSQLLLSFEEAAAARRRTARSQPLSGGSSRRGSGSAPNGRHARSASTSAATPGVPLPARYGEQSTGEEFSEASPHSMSIGEGGLPGPRSAHFMTVLQLMEQVNRENEELERRVKNRAGMPYKGSFQPPRLHFNPLVDGFRGYSLSQVECHNCRAVSRVVSAFNGLMLDIPTTKQRKRFAMAHPDVPRHMDPDGQPRHVKKPFRLTWWNPISLCAAAWAGIRRFFEGPFLYPLWLDECLDIHFQPELLHGSNRYNCESCGTISDATKSETLLQLPEYLLVHMKRFEANRFFNRKKTESVFFPASWQPLTPAQARAQPSRTGSGSVLHSPPRATLPEFLDLRNYLDSSVASFAEPLPACLDSVDSSTTWNGNTNRHGSSPSSSSRTEPHNHHHHQHHHHYHHQNDQEEHHHQQQRQHTRAASSDVDHTAGNSAAAGGAAAAGNASQPNASSSIVTTYTLEGIVNHHGGYDGGHYTVFLHKMTGQQRVWVYVSDSEVELADEVVATDTEYVLLYRRQPLVQAPPEADEAELLRRKACYYLSPSFGPGAAATAANAAAAAANSSTTAAPHTRANGSHHYGGGATDLEKAKLMHSPPSTSPSPVDGAGPTGHAAPSSPSSVVYISRLWLQRVAFMREPGPIVNALCYCRPEDRRRVSMYASLFPATVKVPAQVPHVHGPPVEWFYVAITPADYEIFYNAFGGGAAVTAAEYEALREMQVEFCADIDSAERHRHRHRGSSARPGAGR